MKGKPPKFWLLKSEIISEKKVLSMLVLTPATATDDNQRRHDTVEDDTLYRFVLLPNLSKYAFHSQKPPKPENENMDLNFPPNKCCKP